MKGKLQKKQYKTLFIIRQGQNEFNVTKSIQKFLPHYL